MFLPQCATTAHLANRHLLPAHALFDDGGGQSDGMFDPPAAQGLGTSENWVAKLPSAGHALVSVKQPPAAKIRVIVDECANASVLVTRFAQTLAPGQTADWTYLAKDHRGIPDAEILNHLLGPGTVLLTQDRVLHNQACDLGFRSYILDAQGNLRRRKLPNISAPAPLPASSDGALKEDYSHPFNPITSRLKAALTERDFKRYRTRRRRIRSYFGSEAQISSVALTIGARDSRRGHICGFFLALAGTSGVKGIRASEGYALTGGRDPAWGLLHALRELFLLQLEEITTELFIVPADALALCQGLLAGKPHPAGSPASEAVRILLCGLRQPRALPCVKGRFFDAMEHKLNLLVRAPSNELVRFNFHQVIQALSRQSPESHAGSAGGGVGIGRLVSDADKLSGNT